MFDSTHSGLFTECMLISHCYLCTWLTVYGAGEILQGMVGGWEVVGSTSGGLLTECTLISLVFDSE